MTSHEHDEELSIAPVVPPWAAKAMAARMAACVHCRPSSRKPGRYLRFYIARIQVGPVKRGIQELDEPVLPANEAALDRFHDNARTLGVSRPG
jgi:hypothetical protein